MLAEGSAPSSAGPSSGCVGLRLLPQGDREGKSRETLLLPILGWASPTPSHPQGAPRPKAAAASLARPSALDASFHGLRTGAEVEFCLVLLQFGLGEAGKALQELLLRLWGQETAGGPPPHLGTRTTLGI